MVTTVLAWIMAARRQSAQQKWNECPIIVAHTPNDIMMWMHVSFYDTAES